MDTHSDQQVALLVSAREAHLRRDWAASYEDFARVHGVGPLDVSEYPHIDIWGGCCGTWDTHLDKIARNVVSVRGKQVPDYA